MSDEYEGLSPTFAEACRKADEEYRRKHGRGPVEPKPILSGNEQIIYEASVRHRLMGRASQSVYDAVRVALYRDGLNYQDVGWLFGNLADFSNQQLDQLVGWIDQRNKNFRTVGTGRPISSNVRDLVLRFRR